jgi:hypothetical protein
MARGNIGAVKNRLASGSQSQVVSQKVSDAQKRIMTRTSQPDGRDDQADLQQGHAILSQATRHEPP